ncbi:MAG: hypothetical protein ACTS27_04775 [Phycisphaerales bacterium]
MNWIAFALAAWLALGAELGLKPALALGSTSVAPSFAFILLAFVAMWAPPVAVYTAALIVGAVLDLTHPPATDGGLSSVVVIGPYALGCLAGCYAAVTARGVLIKQNPLSFAFLALVLTLVAHAVVLTLLRVRASYDDLAVAFTSEVGVRLSSTLYTAVVALLVGPLLRLLIPLFGFPATFASRNRRY